MTDYGGPQGNDGKSLGKDLTNFSTSGGSRNSPYGKTSMDGAMKAEGTAKPHGDYSGNSSPTGSGFKQGGAPTCKPQ